MLLLMLFVYICKFQNSNIKKRLYCKEVINWGTDRSTYILIYTSLEINLHMYDLITIRKL